jgi:polysaccharide chain length determinant protein (PEP-CTERM system associated)
MLPGRKYTPDEVFAVLRRRIWLLLVPFAVVGAGAAVLARALPDIYQAQATISVVPQQVPTSLVPATVTTRLSDRVQAIQDRVLSRPRLEKLILELNLYADERREGLMADIVQRMRTRDLRIVPNGPVAFRVTYNGREPVSAMRVAQEVASAFISESLLDRERLSTQTNDFLESATENARLQLVEREQRVAGYKLQYAGELPTQISSNMQQMANINTQLQANGQAANAARQQRIQYERDLTVLLQTPASALPVPAATDQRGAPPPTTTMQQLAEARRQLNLVSAQYTPIHPDVLRYTEIVKDLEVKAAIEAATSPAGGLPAGMTPAEALRQQRIQELQKQLAEIERQLATYEAEEQRLRQEFQRYQARVEAAPKHETELIELTRDYDEINATYSERRRALEQAMLAANLQRREIGEQFQMLEPAVVPQRPFSPNRPRIALLGMLAGLAFGVGLVALLEYRDNGFKTDEQVAALLGLPVLAVVPVMRSEQERRWARLWRLGMHVGCGTTVAGCLAVLAYTFVR